jgi:hypothetical protein
LHWAKRMAINFRALNGLPVRRGRVRFHRFLTVAWAVVRDDLPKPTQVPSGVLELSRYDASSAARGQAMRRRGFITLFGGASCR